MNIRNTIKNFFAPVQSVHDYYRSPWEVLKLQIRVAWAPSWYSLRYHGGKKILFESPRIYPKEWYRRALWQMRAFAFYRPRVAYRLLTGYYERHPELKFVRASLISAEQPAWMTYYQPALALAAFLLFLVKPGRAFPLLALTNYYVRKSGNDSNNGTTPALAELTITAGLGDCASSGDTVFVGAGIYKETLDFTTKSITLTADITGENTGDAGEVILSGINSANNTSYATATKAITGSVGCGVFINNLVVQNWRFTAGNGNGGIYISVAGGFTCTLLDCVFANLSMVGEPSSAADVNGVYLRDTTGDQGTYDCERILVADLYGALRDGGGNNMSVRGFNLLGTRFNSTFTNIEIRNLSGVGALSGNNTIGSGSSGCQVLGFNVSNGVSSSWTVQNISVHELFCTGSGLANTFGMIFGNSSGGLTIYNCLVQNLMALVSTGSGSAAAVKGFISNLSAAGVANNCSVNGLTSIGASPVNTSFDGTWTQNSSLTNFEYFIRKPFPITRFTTLGGQGNATYPALDVFGNPRPAYGNTNANIGAMENTWDNVQKETTVSHGGSDSLRGQYPPYFKRTFQIPVTASVLRTVTVWIRIDGTWSLAKYPKITLSGQGMTPSSATKNSTTGAFQQLTVSGTPATTGLALLTIEAHETNATAIMYVDDLALS